MSESVRRTSFFRSSTLLLRMLSGRMKPDERQQRDAHDLQERRQIDEPQDDDRAHEPDDGADDLEREDALGVPAGGLTREHELLRRSGPAYRSV